MYNISISEEAAEQVKKRLLERNTPFAYVRFGVRGGACAGYSYVFEYKDDPPTDKDLIFNYYGITIVVDKKSILYLDGTTIDFEQTLMFTGFRFANPMQASTCGCGNSFGIKDNS